jgi:hypothetical protein
MFPIRRCSKRKEKETELESKRSGDGIGSYNRDPLALLADVAAQKEILNRAIDEEEEEEEEQEKMIDPPAEPEEIEEDNRPVEQEDGSIMIGFWDDDWNRDDDWNGGEEATMLYRQLLTQKLRLSRSRGTIGPGFKSEGEG